MLALVPLGLLSGCSTDSAETPLTIVRTAADVARAPMLRWRGSWGVSGVTVTADLRAMDTGDVFGTLQADGRTAEVILIGDEYTYIKADREMWRANGVSAKEAAAYGGRWVDDRGTSEPAEAASKGRPITGEILGLDLAWLTPGTLGQRISNYSPSDASATATPRPAWSAAPSTSAATDRPDEVPSTARRFDMPDGEVPGKRSKGTYWVSADSPHRLVAYSGFEAVSTSRITATEPAVLTVEFESRANARAAYADLISTVETLPSTLPARTAVTENSFDLDSDFECGPACATGVVSVTGENRTQDLTIRGATVEVVVTARETSLTEVFPEESVASCTVTLPRSKPGKNVQASCSVSDPRLTAAVEAADDLGGGYKAIGFDTEESITSLAPVSSLIQTKVLATVLRNHEKSLSTGT
ncbi:hypothetical protein [Streptomyces caniscabiei]|uniref:hypothetical protein n=1 Tax=Streptomyces caniscabiei TaxID=2746961 RepID=UPI00117D9347|nr:hypothetical protein [Streptomyces caniscabiei]